MRIALVGEAWGKEEAFLKAPFVGSSGQILMQILKDVGLSRSDVFLTNVLNLRPGEWWAKRNGQLPPGDGNDLKYVTLSRAEALEIDKSYSASSFSSGRYLHPELLPEVERLRQELESFRAGGGTIAIALGGSALWALSGSTGIVKSRGVISTASLVPGLKMLPTYHPAAVMREWGLRTIVLADVGKAVRESASATLERRSRTIFISPTLDDLEFFWDTFCVQAERLSVDIETSKGQITCIGVAPNEDQALVLPFWKNGLSYWATPQDEVLAYRWMKKVLESPKAKLGQNFLYDLQYLMAYGIKVNMRNSEDTMLLHHAMYPELEKSLGFLGTVYCNEMGWKQMRPRGKAAEKKNE